MHMCGLYPHTYEIVVECFALCTPMFSFVYIFSKATLCSTQA